MEREIELQFSHEVLSEAAQRFGMAADSLKLLGEFENYVYEGKIGGTCYVLRLTHSSHRSTNMVLGELEWINFLAENGVSVAKALPSTSGKLAEEIHVGEDFFIASVFQKAKGRLLDRSNPAEPTREVITEWGRTIGKMHRATKHFEPSEERFRRPQWFEDNLMCFENHLPAEDKHIVDIGYSLLEYAKKLPQSQDSYGLIHTDVHMGNFFVDEGKITVFDFDDCSYQWFASDIAIALYYTIWWKFGGQDTREKDAYAREFLRDFMIGYNAENRLEDYWLNELPFFMKLRDIILYAVFHKKLDQSGLQRFSKLLDEIRTRIEQEVPIAVLDSYQG
ncbi:MAG: phosphotransferase [Bacillota bacterium]|jgi:Ser/Thr protein kinase RdoA (MazF antagonist)|nr:phosphotransferase [Bacillota bacterium]